MRMFGGALYENRFLRKAYTLQLVKEGKLIYIYNHAALVGGLKDSAKNKKNQKMSIQACILPFCYSPMLVIAWMTTHSWTCPYLLTDTLVYTQQSVCQ